MRHSSTSAFLVLLLCLFTQCGPQIRVFKAKAYFEKSSPGTTQVWQNYYCDKYEVSNAQWRNYTRWLSAMYGPRSSQRLRAQPDSSVWLANTLSCSLSATVYHKHPAYDDDPVVGISQAQAASFAHWRSDRIFEGLLIRNGVIKSIKNRKNKAIFSIEAFFKGKFTKKAKCEEWKHVPEFRLPSSIEHSKITAISDSVNTAYFNGNQLLKPDGCEYGYPHWNLGIEPDDYTNLLGRATRPVFDDCVAPKPALFHLRGNVSEWLSEPDAAAGGGWIDRPDDLKLNKVTRTTQPNAWTGFRCVMEWKERDLD